MCHISDGAIQHTDIAFPERGTQNLINANVTRQIHEGVYLNWLHKTILQLSHLFQTS